MYCTLYSMCICVCMLSYFQLVYGSPRLIRQRSTRRICRKPSAAPGPLGSPNFFHFHFLSSFLVRFLPFNFSCSSQITSTSSHNILVTPFHRIHSSFKMGFSSRFLRIPRPEVTHPYPPEISHWPHQPHKKALPADSLVTCLHRPFFM